MIHPLLETSQVSDKHLLQSLQTLQSLRQSLWGRVPTDHRCCVAGSV